MRTNIDIETQREKVRDAADIVDVISEYVKLTQQGANFSGLCPFHNEKTASFVVNRKKQLYKCFGCGKGGDVFDFVMNIKRVSFIEAMQILARRYNVDIENFKPSVEDIKNYESRQHRQGLLTWAAQLFATTLNDNNQALEYCQRRGWTEQIRKLFGIGLCPKDFINIATQKGYAVDDLREAGLISSAGKNMFFNRLMFPLVGKNDKPVAFAARLLEGGQGPKYLNSPETSLFHKRKFLYNYNAAIDDIVKLKKVYIVEGYADVIKLVSIGIRNVVATCGTALTSDHLKMLNSAKSITLIADSDPAGDKSIINNGKMIVESAKTAFVMSLPVEHDQNGERRKLDPDSFFTSKDLFDKYSKNNEVDFINYYYDALMTAVTTPIEKGEALDSFCQTLTNYPDFAARQYVNDICERTKISPKYILNILNAHYKIKGEATDENEAEEKSKLSNEQLKSLYKYAFYEDDNCYYFKGKDKECYQGSNFVIRPIAHIESLMYSKRVFEIKNIYGYCRTIELNPEDLISISKFRQKTESVGNFIFSADSIGLMRLKGYLFENTLTCLEIMQLGWNKKGFFAWGNGITYKGVFHEVDAYGIVKLPDDLGNFYLPAYSLIYKYESGLFQYERKFIYRSDNNIEFADLFYQLFEVFGDNGIVGLAFVLATMYKDIIMRTTKLPVLNLFGPKGSGKSKLAWLLLQFFGKLPDGNNINNTSRAALADDVSRVSNALVHIEEYKNNIEPEKIEFLKGLWDGRGRTRMNMDKDKKSETTATDSGIVLSGQEMPTADIALYSRLVALTFTTAERSDAARARFDKLMAEAEKGFTHLTHQALLYRNNVEQDYKYAFTTLAQAITERISHAVEDRIFYNWVSIFAVFNILKPLLKINISEATIIELIIQKMKYQNQEVSHGNEVSVFWRIVEYLYSDEKIRENFDFKIETTARIQTDLNPYTFPEPRKVLYLQHAKIFQLYREKGKQAGETILPINSLEYYLKNSKEYLGRVHAVRFRAPEGNVVDTELSTDGVTGEMSGYKKYKVTSAFAFDYDKLKINIDSTV